MKILMIAPEPFFEPRGTPLSVFFRSVALSKLGHEIDILTYPIGKPVDIKNVNIVRTANPFLMKKIKVGPSLKKIPLDTVLLFKAMNMLKHNKYDCLLVHEEASVIGALLKKWYDIPLIYDMHSSMPQQLVNYNFTNNNFIINLFSKLEKFALTHADAVIVVCHNVLEKAKEYTNKEKIVLIENTSTIEKRVSAREILKLKKELGIKDQKIVLYAGTFEHNQGLDILVKTIPLVIESDLNVKYVMVGGEEHQIEKLRQQAKDLGVEEYVIFTGKKDPHEVPVYTQMADILVSPRSIGTNTPLKIYSYLKSGKPIVATDIKAHTMVLTKDIAVISELSEVGFAEGIRKLIKSPSFAKKIGKAGKMFATKHFGDEQYLNKVGKVCEMVV